MTTERSVQRRGPLSGIKVLDMTSVVMGPYATQFLGDYGADVIKVESPEGDVARQIGPMKSPKMGPIFLNSNRSKRSIVLDLKQPAGREALLKIASTADVVVYNVRPQAMRRLKLGFEDFLKVNPAIVYAGLFGFGQDGPYAGKPAYDDLIQGAATLPSLIGLSSGGAPRYVPTALADRVVGLTAIGAILACIIDRDRTGRGQQIDVPMFETMVGFVLADHLGGLSFEPPLDRGGYARQLSPERRPFQTADGFICVVIFTDAQWQRFFDLADRPDLKTDPRFSSIASRTQFVDLLYAELRAVFSTRSTLEWRDLLEEADIPAMPLYDVQGVLADEHLSATKFFGLAEHPTEGTVRTMRVPATWSEGQLAPARLAPRLGEHGREILSEAGFSAEQIADLISAGATTVTNKE
jgi:formyl-CoA transferase